MQNNLKSLLSARISTNAKSKNINEKDDSAINQKQSIEIDVSITIYIYNVFKRFDWAAVVAKSSRTHLS